MDRNQTTTSFLGCFVSELNDRTDLAARIENHVPGQVGDLAGSQPGFHGEEDDYLVTFGVEGGAGVRQKSPQLSIR